MCVRGHVCVLEVSICLWFFDFSMLFWNCAMLLFFMLLLSFTNYLPNGEYHSIIRNPEHNFEVSILLNSKVYLLMSFSVKLFEIMN